MKQAMDQYWYDHTHKTNTREWHFTRASDNIKKYTVSKVVDRHHSEDSHLPFLLDQDV